MSGENTSINQVGGSKDGIGGGADHDRPYEFGKTLHTDETSPFTGRQYGRLLAFRSRVRAEHIKDDFPVNSSVPFLVSLMKFERSVEIQRGRKLVYQIALPAPKNLVHV